MSKKMFDYVIGNPPYQEETGGHGKQAKPVYNKFVEQIISLNPDSMCIVIPSRWFSGGMGLDTFRERMLNDDHIKRIYDFANTSDAFIDVDVSGGICYILWDSNYHGKCKITNYIGGSEYTDVRALNEFSTFIRFSKAVPIVRKVFEIEKPTHTLEDTVSPQKPFGLPTNYKPRDEGVPCYFIQKIGKKFADPNDISDNNKILNKWKLLVPRSPIAGQTDFTKPVGFYYDGNTRIAKPGECCTESFIVAGAFDTQEELLNFKSYLYTKIVRFLLLQAVVSQDVLRNKFCFVPSLDRYDQHYTDDILRKRWNIEDQEWKYIDSRIHNYEKR